MRDGLSGHVRSTPTAFGLCPEHMAGTQITAVLAALRFTSGSASLLQNLIPIRLTTEHSPSDFWFKSKDNKID